MVVRERTVAVTDVSGPLDTALTAAVADGQRGESRLVETLRRAPASNRVLVITALGESDGPWAVPVLRSLVISTSPPDERCAGLVALAKREGPAASDVFAGCLGDRVAAVRRYALQCLACVGDGRAWPAVYRLLWDVLTRTPPASPDALDIRTLTKQSDVVPAVGYLARHLFTMKRARVTIELIRSRWDRLYAAEQEWLETYWPACRPECSWAVAALRPDPGSIARWLSHPLLLPVYRPDW